MSTAEALVRAPQSTNMGLFAQAPNQTVATVVPLDRENLTFFANMIKNAGLIPVIKDVSAEMSFSRVMAKIVAGTPLGFDPILSQSCFDVVFNSLGLNANGKGILFRESGEYDLRFISHDDKGCKVAILKQIDGVWKEVGTVEFNEAMAQKAGLLTGPMKAMWEKYARDMYYARVITRAVKRFNPACLKPKLILGNHFARESQPAYIPSPAALPPVDDEANGFTEHAEPGAYVDAEYSGPAVDDGDDEIEGEVVEAEVATEITSDDSKIADLYTACKDKINELTNGEARKVAELLNGRNLGQMDLKQLQGFWKELNKAA